MNSFIVIFSYFNFMRHIALCNIIKNMFSEHCLEVYNNIFSIEFNKHYNNSFLIINDESSDENSLYNKIFEDKNIKYEPTDNDSFSIFKITSNFILDTRKGIKNFIQKENYIKNLIDEIDK